MTQKEQLFGPVLRGVPYTETQSAVNQWAGRTTLNSGSATVTVSTRTVKADSLILLTAESSTNQTSGFGAPFEVKTISAGNFFTLGTADGQPVTRNAGTTIMWLLINGS